MKKKRSTSINESIRLKQKEVRSLTVLVMVKRVFNLKENHFYIHLKIYFIEKTNFQMMSTITTA